MKILKKGLFLSLLCGVLIHATNTHAGDPELPPLAKMRDANKNNRIERNEAAGPLVGNFDSMDCDKSGNLDGKEILGFFQGVDCPKKTVSDTPKKKSSPSRPPNELLFNLYIPRTISMFTNIVKPWSEAVASSTNGLIKIKFTASSLAPIPRQLRMVSSGVADAGMGLHHFTPRRTVTARISELPFAARSSRAVSIAAWRTVKRFSKESEYKGVELMGLTTPPPTLIFNSKKAIKTIKDFRSLKMLVSGSLVKPAKLLGAAVVGIPLPFAYEQFSRGIVDGTMANFGGIKEFRLSKFIKFATPIPGGVGNTSIFIVINKKKFDGFSKVTRDAIMRVSGEKFGEYSAGWDRDNKASTKFLKKAGIQEIPLPPKAMAELRKRWSVIEPKWIKDAAKLGIDGKAAVKFYRNELAKIEGVK
jgi:TRAP-type C4-dicarboxylate transport system substrate-binding protein